MSGGYMDYPNTRNSYTNTRNSYTASPTPPTQSSSSSSSQCSHPPPNSSATSSPPPPPPPPALCKTKPRAQTTPSFHSREDCWSPEATFTLIEAWGQRYLFLNRGSLRQIHWRDVAAAVNSRHSHTPRTDIQCKNRIDTVKKKYKIEKSRVSNSAAKYISSWPFFKLLDSFIGDSFKSSPAIVSTRRKKLPALPPPPSAVPVGPRSKRPMSGPAHIWVNESITKRRFLPIKPNHAEEEEVESSENSGHSFQDGGANKEGYVRISEAIGRCGDIYKRVEEEKLRQMIELEKQRMLFAKELEIQRMKLLAESQVHLERIRCAKRFMKRPRTR